MVLVIWFVVYQVQWVMNATPIVQTGQSKPTPVIQAVVIDESQIKEHFQKLSKKNNARLLNKKLVL